MTNYLAIVWLGWITNTMGPVGDGPRGSTWFHTNIASAVIVCPVPGFGNVTNTVPLATNIIKHTITKVDIGNPYGLPPVPKK